MTQKHKKTKLITNNTDRYDYVMGKPYVVDGHFTGEHFTFRLQGVDLKNFAYRVWVTNGIYYDNILVHCPYFRDFMLYEKKHYSLFIDDSGIGLNEK